MNAWWRGLALVGTIGALLATAAASGCGDSKKNDDDGNGGGGGGGGGGAVSSSELNFEILSADVPAGAAPFVRFKATDAAGNPIDLPAEIQAQAASPATATRLRPRFTLAQLEDDGDYVSYFETTATGAQGSATQAVADPPTTAAFPLDRLAAEGNGVYKYTFSTPNKTGLDRTRTHTVGMWATRTVVAAGKEKAWPAAATFNFVPGGAATAEKFEVVADSACNTCHGVLQAHDSRTKTQLCITCHSPQSVDPDTGNTVDFKVMVHKIHRGANLPSVRTGTPYQIIGFRGTVFDFSEVGFPRDIRDCTACHQGEDADNWKTKASLTACTACHDNVRFDGSGAADCSLGGVAATGGSDPCDHKFNVPQTANCAACHAAGAAVGPDVVHVNPALAAAATFKFEITGVTIGADRIPIVQYRVLQNGTAMALDAEPWTRGAASRLFVDVGWPSVEYDNAGAGANGQPVQINALPASGGGTATAVAGQTNVYQVTSPTAIPAGVDQVTVVLEGHPAIADPVNAGASLRVPVVNDIRYVTATGAPGQARRVVVATESCNKCHGLLSAHGQNRNGNTQVCAVCHNPAGTDAARVPAGGTVEPIDFKVLIHQVHASQIKQNDVTIYGFGGTPHVFPLGFPGRVGDCAICHTGTTYQLPLAAEVKDTINPAGGTTPKTIAVCTACHDTVKFDGSAAQACGPGVTGNCNHRGGTQSGDAQCATCHGAGGISDVAKVHPITAAAP